jgi:hypothetical protein
MRPVVLALRLGLLEPGDWLPTASDGGEDVLGTRGWASPSGRFPAPLLDRATVALLEITPRCAARCHRPGATWSRRGPGHSA